VALGRIGEAAEELVALVAPLAVADAGVRLVDDDEVLL